jgi:hypothetical protein
MRQLVCALSVVVAASAFLGLGSAEAAPPDTAAFANTWSHHDETFTVSSKGMGLLDVRRGGADYDTTVRFDKVVGHTAFGTVVSTQDTASRFAVGEEIHLTAVAPELAIFSTGSDWLPMCGQHAQDHWREADFHVLCGG